MRYDESLPKLLAGVEATRPPSEAPCIVNGPSIHHHLVFRHDTKEVFLVPSPSSHFVISPSQGRAGIILSIFSRVVRLSRPHLPLVLTFWINLMLLPRFGPTSLRPVPNMKVFISMAFALS